MPTLRRWLTEYGDSHQNHTNKTIHCICVPAIFFAIKGLFYSIKLPFYFASHHINLAMVVLLFKTVYYFILSKTLLFGMFLFNSLCLLICHLIEMRFFMPLWAFSKVIFIPAWAGQFYGHKMGGKKPSFLKDILFLLICPAWLMSFIYERLVIKL